MTTSIRSARMRIVRLAMAACAAAVPVRAQQLAALTVGPVRQTSAAQGRAVVGDSLRTLGVSVVPGGFIIDEGQSYDGSAPVAGIPLDAPQRRCEAVFPYVSLAALGVLAMGAVVQILPGARPFREIILPVAVVTVVAISFAAVICNR